MLCSSGKYILATILSLAERVTVGINIYRIINAKDLPVHYEEYIIMPDHH